MKTETYFEIIKKTSPFLIGAYIFLYPFRMTTITEVCFYGCVFLTILLLSKKKINLPFRTPLTDALFALLLWAFIGLFFAIYPQNSIHDFYSYLLKNIILYFLIIMFFNQNEKISYIYWILIVSGTVFAISSIVYFYLLMDSDLTARLALKNTSINWIGYIALASLISSLFKFEDAKNIYLRALLVLSILVSTILIIQSLGSFLGLFFSLVILVFCKKKMVSIYSFLLIIFLILAISYGWTISNRVNMEVLEQKIHYEQRKGIWLLYMEVIKDHPIKGIGYGLEMWQYDEFWNKYAERIPKSDLPDDIRYLNHDPHNMFLSIAVHLGIVGLMFFLYLLFTAARHCINLYRKGRTPFIRNYAICSLSLLAGYVVKSLFEEGLSHISIVLFYTILSMITCLYISDLHHPAESTRSSLSRPPVKDIP
jgi:O-antigen ligase